MQPPIEYHPEPTDWRERIMRQANSMPVSEKIWEQEPKQVYEWRTDPGQRDSSQAVPAPKADNCAGFLFCGNIGQITGD